jgi:polysaccharide export outer membrane protein
MPLVLLSWHHGSWWRGAVLVLLALLCPPLAAQQVPAGAKTLTLGAGDVIRIAVFQNTDLTLEARVDGEGRISYPFLGTVDVGGRTTAQVEQLLARGLEQQNVLKRPQVSVTLTQFRSQQIAVLGFVNRPGQVVLDMAYSVTGAIAQAGGVAAGGADIAVLSRVRDGQRALIEVDLVRLYRPGAASADDVLVQPGDVVYVHRAPAYYVYGEVQRPGMQRLERDMTVMQALAAGGGLTPRGTERGLRVTRRGGDGRPVTEEVGLDTPLQADDVLYVRESLF